MSFGTNTSGYREHEMRRQNPMLIGVSLSQKTAIYETPQACHSSFLPHKRWRQGRGFMA
jgi:hypothetical protein